MSDKRDKKNGDSDSGPTRRRAYQKITGNEGPSPLLKRYLKSNQGGQPPPRFPNDQG